MSFCVVYKVIKTGNEYRYGPKKNRNTATKLLEHAVTQLQLEDKLVRVGNEFYKDGTLICTMNLERLYKI
jgi:hypothetical protein